MPMLLRYAQITYINDDIGCGLESTATFNVGELVAEMKGDIFPADSAVHDDFTIDFGTHQYLASKDLSVYDAPSLPTKPIKWVMDCSERGTFGNYINHSCSQRNVILIARHVDGQCRIGWFASTNISAGEPLLGSYVYDDETADDWGDCHCGKEPLNLRCCGKIRAIPFMPTLDMAAMGGVRRSLESIERCKRYRQNKLKVCLLRNMFSDFVTCDMDFV